MNLRPIAVGIAFLVAVSSSVLAESSAEDESFDIARGAGLGLVDLDTEGVEYLPAPEDVVIVFPDENEKETRAFRIEFVTRNIETNEVIAVFVRTADGEYWPVPEERLTPRRIPINQRVKTRVEVVGIPRGEPFSICLYALGKRGQEMVRNWFESEEPRKPFRTVAHAVALGSVPFR